MSIIGIDPQASSSSVSVKTRGPHWGTARQPRDSVRGTAPIPARSWLSRAGHRLTLRLTLQVVILGLLLCTVLAIGIVNFLSARRTTRLLESMVLNVATRGVEGRIRAYFDPAVRTMLDLQQRAMYSQLPINDADKLGTFLVDRLRYERTLNQLQYVAASSSTVVSARRYGRCANESKYASAISSPLMSVQRKVEERIELVIGDTLSVVKRPDSWVVQRDGSRTPLAFKLLLFDSRERPWYRDAVRAPGVTWLDDIRTFDNIRIAHCLIRIAPVCSTRPSTFLSGLNLVHIFTACRQIWAKARIKLSASTSIWSRWKVIGATSCNEFKFCGGLNDCTSRNY